MKTIYNEHLDWMGLIIVWVLPSVGTYAFYWTGVTRVLLGLTQFGPHITYSLTSWSTFAILLLMLRRTGLGLRDVGFTGTLTRKDLALAVLFFFIGICIFAATTPLIDYIVIGNVRAPEFKNWLDYRIRSWVDICVLLFYAVLSAPICEETFFRGYSISLLKQPFKSQWLAGLVSLIAFGLVHIPAYGLRGFIQIGLLWTWLPTVLFIKRKSLYPGIAMHAINNLFAYILLYLIL